MSVPGGAAKRTTSRCRAPWKWWHPTSCARRTVLGCWEVESGCFLGETFLIAKTHPGSVCLMFFRFHPPLFGIGFGCFPENRSANPSFGQQIRKVAQGICRASSHGVPAKWSLVSNRCPKMMGLCLGETGFRTVGVLLYELLTGDRLVSSLSCSFSRRLS